MLRRMRRNGSTARFLVVTSDPTDDVRAESAHRRRRWRAWPSRSRPASFSTSCAAGPRGWLRRVNSGPSTRWTTCTTRTWTPSSMDRLQEMYASALPGRLSAIAAEHELRRRTGRRLGGAHPGRHQRPARAPGGGLDLPGHRRRRPPRRDGPRPGRRAAGTGPRGLPHRQPPRRSHRPPTGSSTPTSPSEPAPSLARRRGRYRRTAGTAGRWSSPTWHAPAALRRGCGSRARRRGVSRAAGRESPGPTRPTVARLRPNAGAPGSARRRRCR